MEKRLFLFVVLCTLLVSCTTGNLYEKVVAIPRHQWAGNYQPKFTFNITDTTSPYRVYVIFRHSEKYNYNNLWLRMGIQAPDSNGVAPVQYELPLATNEKGWLASGLDDLYEHRIGLTPESGDFYFKKSGTYTFTIAHLMREDPLQASYNIGLRIERKQ